MDESEVLKFEQQIAPMALSAAIRIGARFRPQSKGGAFNDGASCAIGAAFEGRTGRTADMFSPEIETVVPEAYASPGKYSTLGWEIISRNDHRKQSREQIADWLEANGY